jgi:hypothetical protein
MSELIKGKHYYINEEGYIVFTAQYHLERGYCCGNGCLHCPYEYENVPEQTLKLPKGGLEESS